MARFMRFFTWGCSALVLVAGAIVIVPIFSSWYAADHINVILRRIKTCTQAVEIYASDWDETIPQLNWQEKLVVVTPASAPVLAPAQLNDGLPVFGLNPRLLGKKLSDLSEEQPFFVESISTRPDGYPRSPQELGTYFYAGRTSAALFGSNKFRLFHPSELWDKMRSSAGLQ